ncbi:hypothetical protein L204_104821 [Cryptococcus depauperatus]
MISGTLIQKRVTVDHNDEAHSLGDAEQAAHFERCKRKHLTSGQRNLLNPTSLKASWVQHFEHVPART